MCGLQLRTEGSHCDSKQRVHCATGVCGRQKMTLFQFSVRFCKKLRFSVQFYKINYSFGFSVRFFALRVV